MATCIGGEQNTWKVKMVNSPGSMLELELGLGLVSAFASESA